MSEHNAENPRFIAYVNMLDTLAEEGFVSRNPENEDHILIYYTDLPVDATETGVSEGWVTENIFDVAQDLYDNEESRKNLFEVLKEQGIEPVFDNFGDFSSLKKIETEKEME